MTWILIRTTGFVAYTFLAGAAIWGLLVSTKILGRNASPKELTYVHESLSVAAILSTVGHLVFLYLDEFVEFGPRELFVPGASEWRPTAVTLGIFAFYGLVVITASFYLRTVIGQKRWRLLHFASFGVFVAALSHGVTAGTDSETLFAVILYTATATAVVFLAVTRGFLLKAKGGQPSRQPAGGTPARRGSGRVVEPALITAPGPAAEPARAGRADQTEQLLADPFAGGASRTNGHNPDRQQPAG